MKKALLIVALAVLPCSLFAQGRVAFANLAGFLVTTNTTSIGGGSGSVDGVNTLKIGLFIAPAGTTDTSLFTLATLDALSPGGVAGSPALATNRSGAFRGLFNGGNPFHIQGNNGTPIAFQVRAWTFSYNDYDSARTAWLAGTPGVLLGSSTIGAVTPATGAATTPALFGAAGGQVAGFEVVPGVPEPSSIALGLLGLGAIALFRRRK